MKENRYYQENVEQNKPTNEISDITGLSKEEILKLKIITNISSFLYFK
ncbi:MAG: hypothetical protein MR765_01830 [Tenericutes bacterium]|nr:hypothetical protein [Mycoplasmatota bacterium]